MTDIELKNARVNYKMQLEGQRKLLECLANNSVKTFANQFFSDTNEESITAVSKDEILRRSFLKTFQNTKQSNNLMVWLNYIQRTNANLCSGRPVLESIDWRLENMMELIRMNGEKLLKTQNGLNIYNLYCDLETNTPYLVNDEEKQNFFEKRHLRPIFLPLKSRNETYQYNEHSLERISKGFAAQSFDRLQLYYFKLLLDKENPKEEVAQRIRSLTIQEKENICLEK